MVEQYADLYAQRDALQADLGALQKGRSADLQTQKAQNAQRRALVEQLNHINRALGEDAYDDDPLLSQWDADIAAGRTPDFSKRAAGAA